MTLEILISTMNRSDFSFLKSMFINIHYDKFEILVINQTSKDKLLKSDKDKIRVINSFEYGLTKSRNLAIQHAVGDICLIADDDVQYIKGFDDIVKQAFVNNPNSSIINFKIKTFCGNSYKAYPENSKVLKTKKIIRPTSSVEMAFKRNDILKNNILFNNNFGLGSSFPSGEEYLFLKLALDKKLIINFENEFIVKHPLKRSTSNMGNDDFVKTQAALYYMQYRKFSYLFLLKFIFFLLRKDYIKFKEVIYKYHVGVGAIKKCKELAY